MKKLAVILSILTISTLSSANDTRLDLRAMAAALQEPSIQLQLEQASKVSIEGDQISRPLKLIRFLNQDANTVVLRFEFSTGLSMDKNYDCLVQVTMTDSSGNGSQMSIDPKFALNSCKE